MTPDLSWLHRGTEEIFPHRPDSEDERENLEVLLARCDRPLRVKLGIDPTGSDLHLGHSIPFRKMRAFQDAGHTAVLIIGDFTARIGDPTGKSEVRRQLTAQQVKDNAETYLQQLRPILDFDTPGRLEIRYNSEWLSELDLSQILELLATMTVGQMLAKEGFSLRYESGNPIYLHEFLYPLMQGYDSVAIDADIELGGTDQKFNLAVGRDLQRHFGKTPQFGLLLPILIGTDGVQKMSKSLNNYVGLKEDALSMYSKLEKTADSQIDQYFELLTALPLDSLPENPRERQKRLALDVVAQYHGEMAAKEPNRRLCPWWGGICQQVLTWYRSFPCQGLSFRPNCFTSWGRVDSVRVVVRAPATSGGAVRLDGDRITDVNLSFDSPQALTGKVLQVGKKKFVRLSD